MSKNVKSKADNPPTVDEALKLARGIKEQGQTKEQTRVVAKGIRKGIEQYKKQQKSKARELDKKLKKVNRQEQLLQSTQSVQANNSDSSLAPGSHSPGTRLPWLLLVITWLGIAAYAIFELVIE